MKKLILLLFCSTFGGLAIAQQSFTTSGTFTVPAGVTSVTVEVIGAGGRGGDNGAGGGGGGGYSSGVYNVVPGETHAVIVGLATSGNGQSSVASLGLSATKGSNGTSQINPQIIGGGGNGGFGIGGQINRTGGAGGGGYYTYFGGGGGGAAGSVSNGGNGGNTIVWTGICQTPGGAGGTSGGFPAGDGGKGAGFTDANCTVTNPSQGGANYGAGGGGANGNGGSYSFGSNGFVQFSWCGQLGAPTGAASQALCSPATVADLVAQGTNIQWYLTPTGGSPLTATTTLTNNTNYYAQQSSGTCISNARLQVLATLVTPFGPPTGNANQSFCNSATVADLTAQGTNIQWYTAATGGTAIANNTALTNNTTYYAEQNAQACETIIRLAVLVNIANANAATTVASTTISATQTGANYSWINCANNQIITNANAQSFTPTITGNYAVIVSNGVCVDTSACVSISFVGIAEVDKESNFRIYPNPVTDNFTIEVSEILSESTFDIVDQNGKKVKNGKLETGENTINIKDLKSGLYVLKMGKQESETHKIIKR